MSGYQKNTYYTRFKIWISVIIFCLYLGLTAAGGARAAEPEAPVRVGYDVTGVLLRRDNQEKYRGYNVEFLYEIAKYTNWNYEFVPYDTWDGALKDLAAGKIDLLPTVLKSPEREKTMLFANHWMGMIHVALVVPAGDKKHFYGDLDSLQGLRIGVRRNTKDAEDVQKWTAETGLKYQLSVYGDNKELLEALDSGQIDAAGLSYIGRARKYRAVVEFAPQEMYFAVAPQRSDLKLKLDTAMSQIAAFNPEFFSNALENLTGRETNPQPLFSLKEQKFIDAHKPIRITFLRQAAPFSYIDENGQYQGLLPKLLERITSLSGLKFTYVPVDNPERALKAVQDGEADVIGRITNNLFFAKEQHLRLTTPYTYLPLVQVTLPGTRAVKTVGMQEHCQMDTIQDRDCSGKDTPSSQLVTPAGQRKKFQLYPTAAACFEALGSGSIDAVYCDSVTAGHFMEQHPTAAYKLEVLVPYSYSFTFGLGPDTDPHLAVIMDKSIRCISVKEIEEMFIQSRMERTSTLKGLLYRLPTSYMIGFSAFLLALIAALIVAIFLLRKQQREKVQLLEQAAITKQEKIRLEELEKSVEEKNQFFANISHDMRTPLNAIIGFSQLAGKEQVSLPVRDYLNKIQSSGTLLLGLINDTLNLSKLSSGKIILKPEPVSCQDLFNNVIIPIREAAAIKHITFNADKSGCTCKYVLMDRLNVEKILLNLLTNAVKYTPEGGQVDFIINRNKGPQPRPETTFTIRDNGIGMSPEFLPHLYDAFSQESETNPGTGLGMAIVKRLIDLMGGTIDVVSAKGQGTTFTVLLPLEECEGPADQTDSSNTFLDLTHLTGAKVLLCEDNELNRQIAVALLRRQGMQVVIAENGQQGVETFSTSAAGEFALILMDVRMPVLDGLEATMQIRALDRRDAASVPIIAMTANTFPEDIEACLKSGMNAHIGKPINPQILYATLAKFLA